MIITSQIQTKKPAPIAEGTYAAVVKDIKPVDKAVKEGDKPELKIEFAVEGAPETMFKRYPASMAGRSPLKRETQAILGRPLGDLELAKFDTAQLLNRNCRVVVVHERNGASRPKAVIKTVLTAPGVSPAVTNPTAPAPSTVAVG
jgi:hypothetical protein